jgi:hypothetical protein
MPTLYLARGDPIQNPDCICVLSFQVVKFIPCSLFSLSHQRTRYHRSKRSTTSKNHFATPSQNLPQHHIITFALHFKMADSQPTKSQAALFQVYLRLRPPPTPAPNSSQQQQLPTPERFLSVEDAINDKALPTHITLNPPNDNRRRAVEKFAFTKVFEEDSSQLDLFRGTGVLELVEGVLGRSGGEGRDGLLATLGVTGSGKVS